MNSGGANEDDRTPEARADPNVVRFPRDWFGPPEELVPFGPSAEQDRAAEADDAPADRPSEADDANAGRVSEADDAPADGPSDADRGEVRRPGDSTEADADNLTEFPLPAPPRAEDFWGESSGEIHVALQGSDPPSGGAATEPAGGPADQSGGVAGDGPPLDAGDVPAPRHRASWRDHANLARPFVRRPHLPQFATRRPSFVQHVPRFPRRVGWRVQRSHVGDRSRRGGISLLVLSAVLVAAGGFLIARSERTPGARHRRPNTFSAGLAHIGAPPLLGTGAPARSGHAIRHPQLRPHPHPRSSAPARSSNFNSGHAAGESAAASASAASATPGVNSAVGHGSSMVASSQTTAAPTVAAYRPVSTGGSMSGRSNQNSGERSYGSNHVPATGASGALGPISSPNG